MTSTPAPTQDPLGQIRDLESRFADAMTQLYAVGNGLARVRLDLEATAPAPAPAPAAAAPILSRPGREGSTSGDKLSRPESSVPAQGGKAVLVAERWWERPGAVARVLGAAGAVITLVGVAFLLAIAIRAGIFGPLPRLLSGAVLAAALVGGGFVARRRSPESTGGEALVATGLAAAYLDLLAATAVYAFIPGPAGLVLVAALTVGTFVLARQWDSQLLAVLAAAPPAALAPMITGIDSLTTLSFLALLLVGSAFAHLGREWRWLYLARTVPAVPVLIAGVAAQRAEPFPTLTVAAVAALGMVIAGASEQSGRLERLPTLAALASSLPLIAGVALLTDGTVPVAASLAALFLAVSATVASVTAREAVSGSLWVAPLVTGTVLIILAAVDLATPARTGLVLAVAGAAYWLVAAWRRSGPVGGTGALLVGLSALTFIEPVVGTASQLLSARAANPLTILHGLALTGLAALGIVTARALSGGTRDPRVTRAAAAAMFVTASTTVVLVGTWLGSLAEEPRLGFFGGHAVATALWTVVAGLMLTVVARRSRDRSLMVRTGLGLVAAAVAKLFLFDLSALSGLFRVVAFVVSGITVLIIGVAYSRTPDGPRDGELVIDREP